MVTVVRPPLSPLSRPNEGGRDHLLLLLLLSFVSRNPLKRLNDSLPSRGKTRARIRVVFLLFHLGLLREASVPREGRGIERVRAFLQTNTWNTKKVKIDDGFTMNLRKPIFLLFLFLSLSLFLPLLSFLFFSIIRVYPQRRRCYRDRRFDFCMDDSRRGASRLINERAPGN